MTELIAHAKGVSTELVEVWSEHLTLLDTMPLPYLDCLMEASMECRPLSRDGLQSTILSFAPSVSPVVVKNLLDLKYGPVDELF